MRTTSVARRYAKALFDVTQSVGDPQAWVSALEAVASALSDPDLADTLRSPQLSTEQKMAAVTEAFPDLPSELRNLVWLLIQRRRLDILPGVAAAFSSLVDDMLGRTEAQVVTARTLSTDELMAIGDHLKVRTGRTVKLQTSTDPALIGGIVIRIGDELIDASVATRLERLRQRLA